MHEVHKHTHIYKAFVNLEESFQEGQFYTHITQNLLLYLQMLNERSPLNVH